MLLGVRIRNFEVLKDLSLGFGLDSFNAANKQEPQALMELSAIIGRNSAGKTSLFKSLRFLSSLVKSGVTAAATGESSIGFVQLKSHGSEGPMCFEITLLSDQLSSLLIYRIEIRQNKHQRPEIDRETAYAIPLNRGQVGEILKRGHTGSPVSPPDVILELNEGRGQVRLDGQMRKAALLDRKLPGLSSYGRLMDYPELNALYAHISRWFFCRFGEDEAGSDNRTRRRQRNLLQIEKGQGEHRHINEDGSNVPNVLEYMRSEDPGYYQAVIREITRRIPHGRDVIKRLQEGEAGSGEEKLFAYFLLMADRNPRPVLFIENPDYGLYYNMIDELATAMRDYSLLDGPTQIILTTHSQNLVETLAPHELWVLYRPDNNGAGTHAVHASGLPYVLDMYREGIGLGSLLYSGHLDVGTSGPEGESPEELELE